MSTRPFILYPLYKEVRDRVTEKELRNAINAGAIDGGYSTFLHTSKRAKRKHRRYLMKYGTWPTVAWYNQHFRFERIK